MTNYCIFFFKCTFLEIFYLFSYSINKKMTIFLKEQNIFIFFQWNNFKVNIEVSF